MNFNYIFTCKNNLEDVMLTLKRHGIAHVPDYLNKDLIPKLNGEFERVLMEPSSSILSQGKHPGNPDGKVARFNPWHQDAKKDFPQIASIFQDEFMRVISSRYFAPSKFDFNDEVIITHELPYKMPTLPWHFVRIQSLKFWFNLTDTTARDGAFEYCPGTH